MHKPLVIALIVGTRPEAIKLLPLYQALKKYEGLTPVLIATGQHLEMIEPIWKLFNAMPDYVLAVMKTSNGLADLTGQLVSSVSGILNDVHPEAVVVQGDTSTAMAGALAAYYSKIPVIHVEAGLRTFDKYAPFPEEINRQVVGRIADIHFCPTETAVKNLEAENSGGEVYNVGNTVLDAVRIIRETVERNSSKYESVYRFLEEYERMILITGHRRENIGDRMTEILLAIKDIAEGHPRDVFVFPVHLNPAVKSAVHTHLKGVPNIHLIEPVPYDHMIYLMGQCNLIITDSGGIQEEAPSFAVPVIITRESTERAEGVEAGFNYLAGSDGEKIRTLFAELHANDVKRDELRKMKNPYGDGHASDRIVEIIKTSLDGS